MSSAHIKNMSLKFYKKYYIIKGIVYISYTIHESIIKLRKPM